MLLNTDLMLTEVTDCVKNLVYMASLVACVRLKWPTNGLVSAEATASTGCCV